MTAFHPCPSRMSVPISHGGIVLFVNAMLETHWLDQKYRVYAGHISIYLINSQFRVCSTDFHAAVLACRKARLSIAFPIP